MDSLPDRLSYGVFFGALLVAMVSICTAVIWIKRKFSSPFPFRYELTGSELVIRFGNLVARRVELADIIGINFSKDEAHGLVVTPILVPPISPMTGWKAWLNPKLRQGYCNSDAYDTGTISIRLKTGLMIAGRERFAGNSWLYISPPDGLRFAAMLSLRVQELQNFTRQ